MAFLNIPLKSIQCEMNDAIGYETMPWYNPQEFPVQPGQPNPAPIPKDYRWKVVLDVIEQNQSSIITRDPGTYNGQDISVGLWIANATTGQAWQIIRIESKTTTQIVAIIQDVYRYNTFRDPSKSGNGGPALGTYIVFNVSDSGIPMLDPVPPAGVSSSFGINLLSRFEYINLQYDYPLYQENNNFQINDVIAADDSTDSFVLSDANNRIVVGRVTSISDTKPGWFTINPVQKIVDNLDYLPGSIGSIIYTDLDNPGELTTDPGGSEIYVKLRNDTSSISYSELPGPTTDGAVLQLNGIDITINSPADESALVTAVNLESLQTGVSGNLELVPSSVETNLGLISTTYGEVVLWASSSPASATINGISVVFDITSTDAGYTDYARAQQMAQSINLANIPNITATTTGNGTSLVIVNSAGGSITIVNGISDINGVPFAGSNSGSGLELTTSASTDYRIKFTAVDARAINFLNVSGTPVDDFGLISVENGIKACGLYIAEGLRTSTTTVVTNLSALYALKPLIGDQAYVINSDDGNGNNVGEWSLWLYDGVEWIRTATQDSATTDAKSLEYTVTTASPSLINVGGMSTGRRVTLITVEVLTPFNGNSTLNIGYQINNPTTPAPVSDGLMSNDIIDLNTVGTYTTSTDILFGTDTEQGDIQITATFSKDTSTLGQAQIIVSYV